jgi:hypothetical protein
VTIGQAVGTSIAQPVSATKSITVAAITNVGGSGWQANGNAFVDTDNVRLVNAGSQSSSYVTKSTFGDWRGKSIVVDADFTDGADWFEFGILDAASAATTIGSPGMDAVGGAYGVVMDVFNNRIGSRVAGSQGNFLAYAAPQTSGRELWHLTLEESGANVVLKLYRSSSVLVNTWTVTKPSFTSFRLYLAARTGGVSMTARVYDVDLLPTVWTPPVSRRSLPAQTPPPVTSASPASWELIVAVGSYASGSVTSDCRPNGGGAGASWTKVGDPAPITNGFGSYGGRTQVWIGTGLTSSFTVDRTTTSTDVVEVVDLDATVDPVTSRVVGTAAYSSGASKTVSVTPSTQSFVYAFHAYSDPQSWGQQTLSGTGYTALGGQVRGSAQGRKFVGSLLDPDQAASVASVSQLSVGGGIEDRFVSAHVAVTLKKVA